MDQTLPERSLTLLKGLDCQFSVAFSELTSSDLHWDSAFTRRRNLNEQFRHRTGDFELLASSWNYSNNNKVLSFQRKTLSSTNTFRYTWKYQVVYVEIMGNECDTFDDSCLGICSSYSRRFSRDSATLEDFRCENFGIYFRGESSADIWMKQLSNGEKHKFRITALLSAADYINAASAACHLKRMPLFTKVDLPSDLDADMQNGEKGYGQELAIDKAVSAIVDAEKSVRNRDSTVSKMLLVQGKVGKYTSPIPFTSFFFVKYYRTARYGQNDNDNEYFV